METVLRFGVSGAVLGGIVLVGWGSMKLVTPDPEKLVKKFGPVSEGERNARESHTEQMFRFIQANARSDNPIWKFEPPPQLSSFAPKQANKPSQAQKQLTARNYELSKKSEELRKKGVKPGSRSDKLIKEIESLKLN